MTLMGFEVRSAKAKGERSSDEEQPDRQPIRAAEKSPAERRNLTNDERKVKRHNRRIHAAFTQPGYYLVDKDATPQSGRYDTMSEAEANIAPESGHLVQYLAQAPNASHIAEPFPPNLNQVNGSLSMSAHTDDEMLFEAGLSGDDEDADEDEGGQEALEDKLQAEGANGPIRDVVRRNLNQPGAKWTPETGWTDEPVGHPADTPAQDYWPENPDDPWTDPETKLGSLQVREAQLLAAMTRADGNEQRRLMGELEGLRRQARRRVIADREIDLADAYIHASLTPVRVHEHHTAATDWISEVAEPALSATAVTQAMVVEARRWSKGVSTAVKEDREEYLEQARGIARITASAMGEHRELAFQTFMRTAAEEEQAPESMVAPWSAPPMQLPPTGGGNAPFGMPQGGAPLNGQNFNPMATEVYPGSQVLPLDNGASAWPPADNLEGEEPLPPVAPDNYNSVGTDTHMSSRRTADAKGYSPRSGMGGRDQGGPFKATHTFSPIGWDVFDPKAHPGSKAITPGVPVQNHGYMSPKGPGGMRLVHVSDEAGNHQTVDSRSLDRLGPEPSVFQSSRRTAAEDDEDDFDREQDQDILERNEERRQPYEWDPRRRGSRRQGSEAFNGPKQTYQEYLARISEGSTPMDEEHWAGSMAAVTPAPSNTVTPVTAMMRWGERGIDADPQGNDLAGNPMAGYPAGGNYDKDEAHAQSGEAQTNLPLAPEGPKVTQHLDFITDFPDTGPGEVPSDRAWNIEANESEEGHGSGVTQTASVSQYELATDKPYDDYALGDTDYMSEIPHDFEAQGNSQYCRHCGESRRHPMHVYARKMTAAKPPDEDGNFDPRQDYATTPGGQAQSTQQYEQAYSSGRHIDYSETGIGQLGTVPVQGYGANPNGEMFTWDMPPGGVPVGAANVADIAPPGAGQIGATQPTDLDNLEAPEGKQAVLRAFRDRVLYNLKGQP
jgi:hypothetical protein